MDDQNVAVEMRGITKEFPGVLAAEDVDFTLKRGEIHALLGENGAGKSTLVNVLTGLYMPERGTIRVYGEQVDIRSPSDAINNGIGMVHQHFMLVPTQTVTENILLGLDEPKFRLNLSHYHEVIGDLGVQYGLHVDPSAQIWQISVGEQQRVEILKMLYRGATILIMDEPTAVLAPQEIEELFVTLRAMTDEGKSIIFISHKLDEVIAIADRITVLRKGKVSAANVPVKGTTKQELANLMVGREVFFDLQKEEQTPGDIVLEVENIKAENDKGLHALKGLSIHVRSGEIVGLAGVAGNGQAELAEVITGLRAPTGGRVIVHGETLIGEGAETKNEAQSVRKIIDARVSHVPEDRTHVGTAPNLSITDNVIMKNYRIPPISKRWSVDKIEARQYAGSLKDSYDIIVPTVETQARLLSGGNLQRLILAREMSSEPDLMIAMQPTRGLDVGAIEGVQRLLLEQRKHGAAILRVSEELEELIALSDRVYAIYEGEIMGELADADAETLGLMMTGTPLSEIANKKEVQG